MIKHIFSVGLMTLLSRFFGFIRDIVMAHTLGSNALTDALNVAMRIPNHFRAIFAEGAFNAAFVPTFNRLSGEKGSWRALGFADNIFTILLLAQLAFLLFAVLAMPVIVSVLAPGWSRGDVRFDMALVYTRITFPYLAFISLTVLVSGLLNAVGRYAVAAASAILLNLCMILAMVTAHWYQDVGYALAVAITVSGLLQFLLVAIDAHRAGVMVTLVRPRLDEPLRRFWRAFGPAILGSAGFQIAIFADTIISSFLPPSLMSAMTYADHINQLPIGVISIAVGTVLISEMSRRIGLGDEAGARHAQLRAMELTLLGALPFVAAFVILPDTIMRALFMHRGGAFTAQNALDAAGALRAYSIGLLAFMSIRAFTVTFHARGDTRTPVIAMFLGVAINVALKILLITPLQHVGLAIGTSVGAWVNVGLLFYFARRSGLFVLDDEAMRVMPRLVAAAVVMALSMVMLAFLLARGGLNGALSDLSRLVLFALVCALSYGASLFFLLGKTYLAKIKHMRRGQS